MWPFIPLVRANVVFAPVRQNVSKYLHIAAIGEKSMCWLTFLQWCCCCWKLQVNKLYFFLIFYFILSLFFWWNSSSLYESPDFMIILYFKFSSRQKKWYWDIFGSFVTIVIVGGGEWEWRVVGMVCVCLCVGFVCVTFVAFFTIQPFIFILK